MLSALASSLRDIDLALFHAINAVCGENLMLDHIAGRLESWQLKGLALMSTFGMLWFRRAKNQTHQRETLVLSLLAVVISLVVARSLADLLPFRPRPMFTSDIGYRPPLFPVETSYEEWSSFPSDTAALVFTLTTGFWLVSRWWGLLWAAFSVLAMTARIYFGVHYPGDVLAGALVGIVVTIALNHEFVRARLAAPVMAVKRQAPAIFYGLLFPYLAEISTAFAFTRSLRHSIFHLFFGFGA
jgi:PAP2 superfamily protein